jgi:hypothetical protein
LILSRNGKIILPRYKNLKTHRTVPLPLAIDRFSNGVTVSFCYHLGMPHKPKPPPDDPEESKRFIDMAREVGAEQPSQFRARIP